MWAIFLLLMPSLSLLAQPLPALIDSAAHHLPVLLQKEALVKAARAGVTDARHTFLPNSYIGDEVSVGSDNALPGSYYSFGLIPSVSSGIDPANNSQAAGGNIAFLFNEYELVNFGLKKATVRRAEANTTVSQADLDREVYLLKWQIGKLFLQIRKSQYQLSIDSENTTRYAKLYTVIRAVTRSGIKPGADSALAMAELSQSRTVYNQTQGQLRQLLQQLSYLTGIGTDQLKIDTVSTTSNFNGRPPIGPVDSIQAANPLLDYYARQRQLYEQTEQLVKKSYLPKILLTGITWARGSSIDYADNYKSIPSGWGYQRYNYLAGLTFQYNLFNLVHRRDKEAIIHQEMAASDYEQKQQQLSLQNLGSKADEGIRTALKNLDEIPVQIRSAQDAFNQKTAQYRAGIINLVDLTNATFVLYRSESAYVQAISDWLLASLDKAAANGGIDTYIQSLK
jgi:outer membrane protein TolC